MGGGVPSVVRLTPPGHPHLEGEQHTAVGPPVATSVSPSAAMWGHRGVGGREQPSGAGLGCLAPGASFVLGGTETQSLTSPQSSWPLQPPGRGLWSLRSPLPMLSWWRA